MCRTITVTVEGGVIQSIDDIPYGIRVVVLDFDTVGALVDPNTLADADNLKQNTAGDNYIESVYEGQLPPEPPVGTERYFEFYVADGRNKGSSQGFRTTESGCGSPAMLDEEKIIELGLAAGCNDAPNASIVEEIGQEEYLERYDYDGSLAEEKAEEDRVDHKRGLYGEDGS